LDLKPKSKRLFEKKVQVAEQGRGKVAPAITPAGGQEEGMGKTAFKGSSESGLETKGKGKDSNWGSFVR